MKPQNVVLERPAQNGASFNKDVPGQSQYQYHSLSDLDDISVKKIDPRDGSYTQSGDGNLITDGSTSDPRVSQSPETVKTGEIDNRLKELSEEIDKEKAKAKKAVAHLERPAQNGASFNERQSYYGSSSPR